MEKEKKVKKKFAEKSFGGKALTILKWGIIGYFSFFLIIILIGIIVTSGDDNKEVSSTKRTEKIEVSDEKEELETPEPEDTSQEEVIEEEPVVEEPEPEIETYESKYPNHHYVGEPYTYDMSGGSTVEFTVTGLGYNFEETFIEFHIKNTGNTQTVFGSGNFRVYADNMSVELDYLADGMYTNETLDPGRELVGKIYTKIGKNQFNILELDMGSDSSTYIIYDAELEAIAAAYAKANYADYVNINANDVEYYFGSYMEVDEVPMEEIAGHYVDKGEGTDLIQYVDISLFSEPDEGGQVGTAFFVYNGDEWNVPFWYMGNNYYTGGGLTVPGVDFVISTILIDGELGNIFIRIFVNGESAGQFIMEYPFIS